MDVVTDYIRLMSPGITLLVMLTGFIGLWMGARGELIPSLSLWCLLGIGLASAGSSIFNNYYDMDIDRIMERTSKRALPTGRIKPKTALFIGVMLSISSFTILTVFVNLLSALLTMLALITYSYLYTILLKRHTPAATEIGGISGSLPPVIGWVAVRGSISLEAIILFMIMYLWQPPHFWALGLKFKDDYKRAGIPTMSVVKSKDEIILKSIYYVSLLFLVSLLPYFLGVVG
ncbi:MAG: protoheme IX farnesyltransferase, partial [Nitrospirae bacterium]